jgi:hypothetical protein
MPGSMISNALRRSETPAMRLPFGRQTHERRGAWIIPREQIPPKLKTLAIRICSKILIWRESFSAK